MWLAETALERALEGVQQLRDAVSEEGSVGGSLALPITRGGCGSGEVRLNYNGGSGYRMRRNRWVWVNKPRTCNVTLYTPRPQVWDHVSCKWRSMSVNCGELGGLV